MPELREVLVEEIGRLTPTTVPHFDKVLCRAGRRRRRSLVAAAIGTVSVGAVASLVLVVGLGGGGADQAATPTGASKTYRGDVVTFRYPERWNVYGQNGFLPDGQHGDGSLVKLSSEDAPFPCTLITEPPWRVTCEPGGRLPAGGVFLWWGGGPVFGGRGGPVGGQPKPWTTLEEAPGADLQVDGYPAKLDQHPVNEASERGSCGAVEATEQVSLHILVGTGQAAGLLIMTACLAAPTGPAEQQVLELIDSIAITS